MAAAVVARPDNLAAFVADYLLKHSEIHGPGPPGAVKRPQRFP
jgi:hypothetical protein